MAKGDNLLAQDMILLCTTGTLDSETAQKGIRALFKYFGGQMIYVPVKKDIGESADKIRSVLADAVGDGAAGIMLEKIMFRFGGQQIYIPLERCAFRKTIALEIFAKYGKDGISMNDLAREYGISFSLAFTLWREGQHEKHHSSLPFLPFLELMQ